MLKLVGVVGGNGGCGGNRSGEGIGGGNSKRSQS